MFTVFRLSKILTAAKTYLDGITQEVTWWALGQRTDEKNASNDGYFYVYNDKHQGFCRALLFAREDPRYEAD